mgnify:CR=1 FL=1
MTGHYQWDERKRLTNLQKHGIDFLDACSIFDDPHAITIADPDHSDKEDRYVTIGRSKAGRLIVVIATDRPPEVRLISARQATPRESRSYRGQER